MPFFNPYSGWSAASVFLGLPRYAGLFWLTVIACWLGLVLVSLQRATADPEHISAALFFAAAAGAAERIKVRLAASRPGAQVSYSVSCAVFVAVALLFPTHWAILIAGLGAAAGQLARRQFALRKLAFNVANMTLSVASASVVFTLSGSHLQIGIDSHIAIPWIVAAALTYFVANTALTSAIVAFVLRAPIRLIWWRSYRHLLLPNLGLLALGVPIAGLWLTYPWMLVSLAVALLALHRAMDDRVKLETQTLESLFELADILDARDKYTHGHSERVGNYAEQLAIQLGLSSDRAHLAFLAGRLHDIGKCAINNEVLRKPGDLDDDERTHMRQHPAVGGAMLAHFSLFREVAQFVRGHHERWDGRGYPDGLRGDAIPLESRIISVVDSYDAMTTTRPYRAAMPHAEAVRRLRNGADRQWDPRVVDAFIKLMDREQVPAARPPQLERPHPGRATVASS
jgi:putative nucleotidyltransferase with HDIG domain